MRTRIRGTVTRTIGTPNSHSFEILGDDGQEYFAHLGDIEHNENILYGLASTPATHLSEGDIIDFEVVDESQPRRKIIHARIIQRADDNSK